MSKTVFCTLFDSNYLDKGIVMYQSLVKAGCDFVLYVLAMDDLCYHILEDLDYKFIHLISMDEFEDAELLEAKKNRSRTEYCWTCSAALLYYVIKKIGEKRCTYVDADLYFYSDPQIVLEEMGKKHVQIVEHGFENTKYDLQYMEDSGKYCVQFNTFDDSEESVKLLKWWKESCLKCCSLDQSNGVLGDQGYLDGWEKYPFVSVVKNKGAGLAPWNIKQFKRDKKDGNKIIHRKTKCRYDIIFYHFHQLEYVTERKIKICIFCYQYRMDYRLIHRIYVPYLKRIDKVRSMLRGKYNLLLYNGDKRFESVKCNERLMEKIIRNFSFRKLVKKIVRMLTFDLPVKLHERKNIIEL